MSVFDDIRLMIAPELEALEALMRARLTTDNVLMSKVIDNYLRVKGKMIRPVLVVLSSRLFGAASDRVLQAGAAVELLHNASLIHDDVVDASNERRGRPTINAVWDNHIAVLVGDFFVSSSMQLAIDTGDVRIIEALCSLGKLLSLGELDQIYNARFHQLSEEGYMRVISRKTASLFVACARMGCYAQGVADERVTRLSRFAELLGMCFQIRDDIFDYYPQGAESVGKPVGNDLREGKVTLPLLYALEYGSGADAEDMRTLVAKEELSEDDIARLLAYARENGGVDYAYGVMARMRDEAVAELSVFDDSEERRALASLFDFVISREN